MNKILHWSPRILAFLFIGFISLFALDVFAAYKGWDIVPAAFAHLVPSLILLGIVIVSWDRDLLGAAGFFLFALYYIWKVGFHQHWSWYLIIAGPAMVIAVLFFLCWLLNKHKKDR